MAARVAPAAAPLESPVASDERAGAPGHGAGRAADGPHRARHHGDLPAHRGHRRRRAVRRLDPGAVLADHAAHDLRLGAAARHAAVGGHPRAGRCSTSRSPRRSRRFVTAASQAAGSHPGWGALHGLMWMGFTVLFFWVAYTFFPGVRELVDQLMWAADLTVSNISETIMLGVGIEVARNRHRRNRTQPHFLHHLDARPRRRRPRLRAAGARVARRRHAGAALRVSARAGATGNHQQRLPDARLVRHHRHRSALGRGLRRHQRLRRRRSAR